jgi:histidinol-phosphate aminotransferase
MRNSINDLLRDNIKKLTAYKSARDEYTGTANIYLDANENPFPKTNNRYPDPHQTELKIELSKMRSITPNNIFIGNGSDEIIDLLIRAFCNPGKDNIVTLEPSYGMYEVCAAVNDIEVVKYKLDCNFNIEPNQLLKACTKDTKIIFLCSPNNPSGNAFASDDLLFVIKNFEGIVAVDEAYIDFCKNESLIHHIENSKNLIVLQTLSKAFGCASLRIGIAYADENLIAVLSKIKPPYNINGYSQSNALRVLKEISLIKNNIDEILTQRDYLAVALTAYREVKKVFPSQANFLLVKVLDAQALYDYLISKGIVIRNRHGQWNCDNCVRITIGTAKENQTLLSNLNEFYHAEDIVFG